MLFSAKYGFIFSQFPRSASTSTALLLQPFCCPPDSKINRAAREAHTDYGIVGQRGDFEKDPGFYVHMPLEEIRARMPEGRWDAATKVSNVRNPFGIYLSRFSRYIRIGELGPFASLQEEKRAFGEFILESGIIERGVDWLRNLFFIEASFQIDKLIHYEALNDEISGLVKQLGLPPQQTFPHAEGSFTLLHGDDIQDYYTPQLAEHLVSLTEWMFVTFGYSTDPADFRKLPDNSNLVSL